jgi:glyceraldehyde-3-phosphate dehydrogenase (NADP+) (phosphorylating)
MEHILLLLSADPGLVACSQRVVDLAHLVAAKWPGAAAAGSGDPLEDFCKDNPETDECKVYEA